MSRRPTSHERRSPSGRPLDERRVEALTIAMALAPGVYVRNRMFAFFAQEAVQRAKARAATLRGIVPQLARACTVSVSSDGPPHGASGQPAFVLRYDVATIRLSRVVDLSAAELAALRLLASRAGLHCLPAHDGDRALIGGALARLLSAGGDAGHLAAVAQGAAGPHYE